MKEELEKNGYCYFVDPYRVYTREFIKEILRIKPMIDQNNFSFAWNPNTLLSSIDLWINHIKFSYDFNGLENKCFDSNKYWLIINESCAEGYDTIEELENLLKENDHENQCITVSSITCLL